MEEEGSIGTPNFKQIIMQKQQKEGRQGVRIPGYDGVNQNGGTNKKKKQVEDKNLDSSTKVRGKEKEGGERMTLMLN